MPEKGFSQIEKKNNIFINVFCYENKRTFLIYVSDQKFETSMDFLLKFIKTSHITCISKILTDLSFTKQRIKTKNTLAKVVYCVLVVKMCWQKN